MNIRTSSLLAIGIVMLTTVSWGADISSSKPVSDDVVQTYSFTGTVENIRPDNSAAAKIGDRVTGTFTIDQTAVSTDINDKHGSYRFASGTPLVFTLNTMKFGAAPSSLPCMASVHNNELDGDKILDNFRMACTDDALKSSVGLAFLAATLNLTDSSAAVFSGTSLPRDVNLQTFDTARLAVIGTRRCNKSEQCSELVFDIMMRIDSITKGK
jgi:hypothetical protein